MSRKDIEMNAVEKVAEAIRADPALSRKLQWAVHTILGGYVAAGCPNGSDDLVRGALVWSGSADPGPSPQLISEAEYRISRIRPTLQ
jgi:hypothetical protein